MIIGKYYKVTQATAIGERGVEEKTWGKVIWIHPDSRFCVLQFDGGIRECFTAQELSC